MRKLISIALAAFCFYSSAAAQDQPESGPVIITTYQYTPLPPGDTSFRNVKIDSLMNYYVDKGVRPNEMIKNFRILRHSWGADSYKTIFLYEINKMENLEKADQKSAELINASFKNEADKKKFWQLWNKLFDRHEDSIMGDWVKPKM